MNLVYTKYIDLILCILLIIQPILIKLFSSNYVSSIDEIIFVLFSCIIFYRFYFNPKRLIVKNIIFVFITYSVVLIFINQLPITHIIQIFLSSKFIIIFWYFNSMGQSYKIKFFNVWIKFIYILLFILTFSALVEIFIPDYFTKLLSIYRDRGIGNFALSSIFGSRILFSEILVLLLIVTLCIKRNGMKLVLSYVQNSRFIIAILIMLLIIFTFSRKEILFSGFIFLILMKNYIVKKDIYIYYILASLFGALCMLLFINFFKDINIVAFSEEYIRFIIMLHSFEVFYYYFPFGSGPGTFGTKLSLSYTDIYEKFNISQAVTGWGGDPGPIFDAFLFSILAEYGLGIFFVLYFIYIISKLKIIDELDNYINIILLRRYFLYFMMLLIFFTPVLLNIIGYIIFITLGLLLDSQFNNISIEKDDKIYD